MYNPRNIAIMTRIAMKGPWPVTIQTSSGFEPAIVLNGRVEKVYWSQDGPVDKNGPGDRRGER